MFRHDATMKLTLMSQTSSGFLGSQATAALQVMTLPWVASSWAMTFCGTCADMADLGEDERKREAVRETARDTDMMVQSRVSDSFTNRWQR